MDDNNIDLSNNSEPIERPSRVSLRKGLPGVPGKNGYDLTIISLKICFNNINFISKGSRGGKGQDGNPRGEDGEPGKDGRIYVRCNQINDLKNINEELLSIKWKYLLWCNQDISSYNQIAYIAINNKKNEDCILSLFSI